MFLLNNANKDMTTHPVDWHHLGPSKLYQYLVLLKISDTYLRRKEKIFFQLLFAWISFLQLIGRLNAVLGL